MGSVTLALSSGIVGALAFTRGFRTTLVGVMVAVALLPPLVTFGLLLGSGNFYMASGAFFTLFGELGVYQFSRDYNLPYSENTSYHSRKTQKS
nr:DUF389 domain-containing protein [Methanobacterium formicicum]